jgi:hypothetical protein
MVVADSGQKLGDVVVVEAVAHPPSLPLGDDEPELAKYPELLGDRAGIQVDGGGELFHGPVSIEELV